MSGRRISSARTSPTEALTKLHKRQEELCSAAGHVGPAAIHRALACLASARAQLPGAIAATVEEEHADLEVVELGRAASGPAEAGRSRRASTHAVESLRSVYRSLEDLAAMVHAGDEDAVVQVVLRQHEKALSQRAEADRLCAVEQQRVADLRSDIVEADRCLGQGRRTEERLKASSGDERLVALQRRLDTAREAEAELQAETQRMDELISQLGSKNRSLKSRTWELDKEHGRALAENQSAREALGQEKSKDAYWKRVEQECHLADESLVFAYEECQEELMRLETQWAEHQARHRQDLKELEAELKELRDFLAQRKAQVEATLAAQSTERGQMTKEVEVNVAAEMQRYAELRQQREMALQKEMAVTQQFLKKASADLGRRLDNQVLEARMKYRYMVSQEDARCNLAIRQERSAVQSAKREREAWERRADRARENCRAHAAKSGLYVKELDTTRRRRLQDIGWH